MWTKYSILDVNAADIDFIIYLSIETGKNACYKRIITYIIDYKYMITLIKNKWALLN